MGTPPFDAMTADRELIRKEWAAARAELDAAFAGLTLEELEETGMTGTCYLLTGCMIP